MGGGLLDFFVYKRQYLYPIIKDTTNNLMLSNILYYSEMGNQRGLDSRDISVIWEQVKFGT